MKRFVQVEDRTQGVLLPEHLDDYVGADNIVDHCAAPNWDFS